MEEINSRKNWQPAELRCPYCVEGNHFRSMVDLTDVPGGLTFCTKCRHLAHPRDLTFKCLCANCRKLNAPLPAARVTVRPLTRVNARRAEPGPRL